ncbi:hypothetical protein B0H10DRAFT_2436679 [Mycena sp. CBHHK59/15]|nr:hypothetical protein B0H10DRAFT_2436679 [Mycena sp. CBHHK59/15]
MANSAAILSTSLPLNKKLKPELQAIARALGITDNATVPSLCKSINEHIRNHAEIADDPRFLPLLAHRSGPKTIAKNSADKLAEEASKPGVPGQAATGANKTLLTNNVKTDPGPQFAKLSSGSRTGPITTDTKDDANEDCESTSSDSGSSISPEPEPKPEEKPKKTPRQQLPRNLPAVVRVNFFDEHNQRAAPRQVCVLANDIPITALAAEDGSTEYLTSLSELLPAAFQNDSPIKGMLFTNTFQSRSLTFPLPDDQRPKFTGSGSDIPLVIATDRALHNPTGRLAAPGVRDTFLRFLHSVFTAAIDDTPSFGKEWPRAKHAGLLLDRHLFEEKVLEMFTAWSRPIGGFVVPQGYANYTGTTFTKHEVLDTINIKSSSSSNDTLLFAPESLMHAPKAQAWYKSGGKDHDDLFRKMTTANFKKYLKVRRDRRHRPSQKNHRGPPSSPGEGPSTRKHKRGATASEDESEEDYYYMNKKVFFYNL